ncbi:hypothetical protein [Brachybacterium tyrofermentans]|uniref:hypothetical protein n=1 Tax=Brachybacterium tyrofermentans TaxID=47848 RepID=UPI003F913C27
MAAQIRQAISSGTICGKCHQIPDDCTCPSSSAAQAADPLRDPAWWEQREDLAAIRSYARASGASPAATLAVTVMRVLAQTPYTVTTPAIVSGPGSLNLFAAIVGPSGRGKGAAASASRRGVPFDGGDVFDTIPPGSGEGLVRAFASKSEEEGARKGDLDWSNPSRAIVFDVAEVSGLAGQMGRSGSSLSDQLLKAFVAEQMGFSYAGQNGITLPEHEYRFTMVAGVQPAASGALLGESSAAVGLPQRFIWASATDLDAPDFSLDSLHRAPVHLELPQWSLLPETVGVDDEIAWVVGQNRQLALRGDQAALDAHRMFARLKVAAAFSFMRGAKHVTAEDWALSDGLMAHSDITRQSCLDELESIRAEENRRRGAARDEVDAAADLERETRIRNLLVRYWSKNPGATAPALVRMLPGRDRKDGAVVAERLAAENSTFPAYQIAA